MRNLCNSNLCSDVCSCNTSCCFGFIIPIDIGYKFCCLWLLFNGFTFPAVSLVFWPKYYIFYISCVLCGINLTLVTFALVNVFFKKHILFNIVLYGLAALYLAAVFLISLFVDLDIKGNSKMLIESFKNYFHISIPSRITLAVLQGAQILYYSYIFLAYVYCGFILQLYEIKHSKKYGLRGRNYS